MVVIPIDRVVVVHVVRRVPVCIGIGYIAAPCFLYDLLVDRCDGAVVKVIPPLRMKVLYSDDDSDYDDDCYYCCYANNRRSGTHMNSRLIRQINNRLTTLI